MAELDAETMRGRFRGCLLAGAVGDALGNEIEFWSLAEIRRRLGPDGATGYVGGRALITDDTQMTLFTAEGMIRALVRLGEKGITDFRTVVHHAYLRWLHTQGRDWASIPAAPGSAPDGWLVGETGLHHRRAPGNTCLSALGSGVAGTTTEPINNSKGCGGVMRAAPIGLLAANVEGAFTMGCQSAAITHGHPSGWLSAGVLAGAVTAILGGAEVREAVEATRPSLESQPGHEETSAALDAAIALADRGMPSPEDLESLGGGWVGEEALAIAVCCAIAAPDLRTALLASVNHSGDSDSTGSICGNLLGARFGESAIPAEWLAPLDLADVIGRVADDLWTERFDSPIDPEATTSGLPLSPSPAWWLERYPAH